MVKYTNTKAKRSKECRQKKINFVHGQGKRKHQLQRDYEQLKDWKSKLKTYQKHLEIKGDYRNSYSKQTITQPS